MHPVQVVSNPLLVTPRPRSILRPPPRKGCLDHTIKPIMFCFFFVNFIFFVMGIAILILSLTAYLDVETQKVISDLDTSGTLRDFDVAGLLNKVMIAIMVVGGIVMLLGFLGFCGVAIGNSIFLYLYGLIVFAAVLVNMGLFFSMYFQKDKLDRHLEHQLDDTVKNYVGSNSTHNSEVLDLTHQLFKCCGTKSGQDFQKSKWYNTTRKPGQLVPVSCCQLKDIKRGIPKKARCAFDHIHKDNPYTGRGCHAAIKHTIFSNGVIVVILLIVIMSGELLAICCAAAVERHYVDQDLAHKYHQPLNQI